MRTDFEASVTREVHVACGHVPETDEYREITFTVGLECTAGSFPGYFDPRVGGEPPSGPDFDITSVSYTDETGNVKDLGGWDGLVAMVGEESADEIFEAACIQADETGDF